MFALLLIALAHCTTSVTAFPVCGNYCGANWCNAQFSTECAHPSPTDVACNKTHDDCSERVPTDHSCADECCKVHDYCCGSSNRKVCNDLIISCLETCESGPNDKCRHPGTGIPVHPKVRNPSPLLSLSLSLPPHNNTRSSLFSFCFVHTTVSNDKTPLTDFIFNNASCFNLFLIMLGKWKKRLF